MKNIIIILVAFVLCSCGRTEKRDTVLIKILNNATDKELFYEVQTEIGTKDIRVNSMATDSIVFFYEYSVKTFFLAYESSTKKLDVYKEIVYNMTDTTVFEFDNYKYYFYDKSGLSEAEQMYCNNAFITGNGGVGSHKKIFTDEVNIVNEFLQFMRKDYSMLEKFPEYYGR
ncbi:MAG: hypothetical protein LBC68_03710 [Prevotellaceae bacterium]|jgi:hypothetical protein|nr:hypothetical protein [Prevotellaceae bacterium]